MKKPKLKISVVGFGSRGAHYSSIFRSHDGIELTAVCDVNHEKLSVAKNVHNLPSEMLFDDDNRFFEKGKLSDLIIISSPDALHSKHALKALELGYDLLLEKPIANNRDDCDLIYETSVKYNRKIFVCHVLRYAQFFAAINEELKNPEYGNISTINLTENVAHWHQAHSYVRGNWGNSETSSPMIIAKCCHDLDILSWLINKKCLSVSSMGSLNFFTSKNAPPNSTDRCYDCPVKTSCIYEAERFYITDRFEKGLVNWPANVLVTNPTKEKLRIALKNGPYGRCVFRCDNNVVDHQVVNMLFEDGVTAHLTMTAFSEVTYREIHIHCERGEIYGNMKENLLHCSIFGKDSKVLDITKVQKDSFGHGGGDSTMIADIVAYYNHKPSKNLTGIEVSMQSHLIGFAAEESRLADGELVKLLQRD